jgi:hypothetical protein
VIKSFEISRSGWGWLGMYSEENYSEGRGRGELQRGARVRSDWARERRARGTTARSKGEENDGEEQG